MGKAEKRVPRAEEMSGYLVKRAQSVIHLALEEIVSKQGLGIPHYVVLSLLAETPGLPNAELARRAFVFLASLNRWENRKWTAQLFLQSPCSTILPAR